jgi:hypothetical protein
MSWRDPDWLPTAAPNTGPDALLLEDDVCEHCEGSGDDEELKEARGYVMDCPHCGGTGVHQ